MPPALYQNSNSNQNRPLPPHLLNALALDVPTNLLRTSLEVPVHKTYSTKKIMM